MWLLNSKSIIIQDDSEDFVNSIEKKYNKCQIIRNAKDLEDFTKFEEDVSYIFIG